MPQVTDILKDAKLRNNVIRSNAGLKGLLRVWSLVT